MKIKQILGAALASTLAVGLTACGGGTTPAASPTAGGTTSASASAPTTGETTELTVWAWEPTLTPVVEAFQKANPDIKINLENVGGAGDTYTKLDNAIAAGSGAPDIAQIEYYAVGQYAIPGRLADLSGFGAADLKDKYTTGTWNAVTLAESGKVFGLPVDSGPMALFYNEEVFTKAGIAAPPATWEEFYEAAKKIRALGPNNYITSDNGDAGFHTSMMWLAGGKPFGIDGQSVTINLGDAGVVSFAEFWQKMIDEDLINTKVSGWSDDWFKGLGDGTLASLITGAWMPANLIGSAPRPPASSASPRRRFPRQARRPTPRTVAPPSRSSSRARRRRRPTSSWSTSPTVTAPRSASPAATSRRPPPTSTTPNGWPTPMSTSVARSTTRCWPRPLPTCSPAGATCRSRSTPTRSSATRSTAPTTAPAP
ncbi:ABC transporter substrate-binding protein [Tessaracoccus coleopterorum]|uniref:ABC transporter substrate-binding protein n=1 Tax=Tessaracoccus coleopterorum TaxID=2714950 RepID=UPI0018D304E3|nr:extracellular solute-binding protein [Tessaracoccus coleopterorum]